jgi:hypothetical protein
MTVKVQKEEARQGERRPGQERVLLLSGVIGAAALAGITLAVILLRPFGA